MSSAAKSLFVYGIYILALSIFLIIAPNLFLNLFGFPTTKVFFKWSIYTRGSAIFVFTIFVLLGFAGLMLILFGVVDFLSAIWTGLALRQTKKQKR